MGRPIIHSEEVVLDHPVDHVWSLLSSFGAVKAWMPSVKWCKVEGLGVGAVRTIMSTAGEAEETVEVFDAAAYRIAYRIKDMPALPAKGCYGSWVLESVADDKTKVKWDAEAEQVSPEVVAQLDPFLGGFMKDCLQGLEKALT